VGGTVADAILDRLIAWSIERIYGFPGDGINGFLGALEGHKEHLEFIQTRHEELAAYAACAHAKFTDQLGVCMATSGPGAVHLLNGLYDAKMDHQPVLAIVGQTARFAMGAAFQQEIDLQSLYKDVAGAYVETLMVPEQVHHVVDRAIRIALDERTVTCLIVPNDLQEIGAEEPKRRHGGQFSGIGYVRPRVVPAPDDLQRAADVLNAGQKVAILIGQGARGAEAEVTETAELLGAGVAKALLGKDVLPDTLPWVTGSLGLLGTKPSWDLMMDCDTLLMIGSGFPYAEFLPPAGQARGVQIDISARMLSLRYPMEVPLCGDARETLRALLPLLHRKEDRSWRETIASNLEDWWGVLDARAHTEANPINPQLLFWELSKRLPDGAILSCDSGSAADWYARDVKLRAGMRASLSGNLATMCPSMPYAFAAKHAYPHRPVIAMLRDGAFQMLGINSLINVARDHRRWPDPRFVVLVLHNRDLNQVTWEQRVMAGDPRFATSQDVPAFDYAGYARLLGLEGIRVDTPDQIGGAWDAAFAADRPTLIDAITDPDVPPLPPHITLDEARHLTASLVHDDERVGVVRQAARSLAAGVLPHHDDR
jgi:pyruvate dehydrogenase (quinone)